MEPDRSIDQFADLTRFQSDNSLLEFWLHISFFEAAQITAVFSGGRILGEFFCQLGKILVPLGVSQNQ